MSRFKVGEEVTVMFKSDTNDRGYCNADNYIIHKIDGEHVVIKYWNGKEYIRKTVMKSDLIWAIDKYNEISGKLKFCKMCLKSPAIQGESLCEECKKTNKN